MLYEKTVVKKPWGYEYLVYQNEKVALWFLYIGYSQQTSMHCHPNKTTGLILLDGEAELPSLVFLLLFFTSCSLIIINHI